jgi:hypothetical protein
MSYELWDHASGNRLGVYATEREALDVVAGIVGGYKSRRGKAVSWLSLLRMDVPPGQGLVAEGRVLAERALAATTPATVTRRRKRAAA